MASRRGIVKGRWDDIVAAELRTDAVINGRPQTEVIKEKKALDPDKPGLGQFYCVSCCRYCISQRALDDHERTSKHKRRLKMLLRRRHIHTPRPTLLPGVAPLITAHQVK